MSKPKTLDQLFEAAQTDKAMEPEFLRRLLDATLYVHTPLSDDNRNLRLHMFAHPDGFNAVPVFTSEAKATLPSGIAARIVAINGRELFEATRGATLMLNPNSGGGVLYPEEIAALLDRGVVATVERVEASMSEQGPGRAAELPDWLRDTLRTVYSQLPSVTEAYAVASATPSEPDRLLILIGVKPTDAERAARASISAAQSLLRSSGFAKTVDLMVFDPQDAKPSALIGDTSPFYQRPTE
jgi:hypothetical protein